MKNISRLFDIPQYQMDNYAQKAMFNTKINGTWEPFSTKEFMEISTQISLGLMKLGVAPGDNIALISENRVEWNIMDIAIQQCGAIVVPIYPNISDKDYSFIFNDANIIYCFVGGNNLSTRINNLKSTIPSLKEIFTFNDEPAFKHWKSIISDDNRDQIIFLDKIKSEIKGDELATIIYTSGTTGDPKGVMLCHNNILSNVVSCEERIPADNTSKVLTFLPACHVYERMLHYLYMYLGCSIYFAESMETIGENIKETGPEIFSAVPRLIEKVFDKIMAKGDELTGFKRKLFYWAVGLAEQYEVEGKGWWYSFKLSIARILIFKKWQAALGGNVKVMVSGSAALQPRLARIFLAAGIPILEGYGLTETSPVVAVNCFKKGIKIGTVGTVLRDVEVKFAEDGEIMVKGPNVMMGYYNLPEKTQEVLDVDGWFHTGDIGEMVDGKFLKITDRKKEIFKTSGGKYIAPQAMENKFKESRFIEQIMVVGEGKKFPAALIVPNFAFLKDWGEKKGIPLKKLSNEDIVKNDKVISRIHEEVEEMNKNFGHWETIKKYHLLSKEFSIVNGELTPTLKFKRKIIMEKYNAEYEALYID